MVLILLICSINSCPANLYIVGFIYLNLFNILEYIYFLNGKI